MTESPSGAVPPELLALHIAIDEAAAVLAGLYSRLPPGRDRALAFSALEVSAIWAGRSITGLPKATAAAANQEGPPE